HWVPRAWASDTARLAVLAGVAPIRSVSTSTPSPLSAARMSRNRAGAASSGESSGWMSCTAICTAASPSTCSANSRMAWPSGACTTMTIPVMETPPSRRGALQSSGEHAGDIEARLLGDLDETGGAGHIHLGDVIADDIQAHHQQPAFGQARRHDGGDLAVALGQRLRHAPAAGGQVAARLAGQRDARQRIRHGFAADQQDALVALDDLG